MAEIVAKQNGVTAEGSNVDFIRPDLAEYFDQYDLIRVAIAGSIAVKQERTKYLPMPNAHDLSIENAERYNGYITRAVFYGVTGRTLSGLSGQVFNVDPTIKVPPILDAVIKDANGSGVPIVQLANEVENHVISYGRAGLFIDFPKTAGKTVTKAQQASGDIRPNIVNYLPWNIINWKTIKRGAKHYLSLVVLREFYDKPLGEFGYEKDIQYRVLALENNTYKQKLYRKNDTGSFAVTEDLIPVGGNGTPLDFIPFTFIGAINNDVKIDNPPLFDLADLNIAHYRNSADYEDSAYMLGQPTPVATGLTQDWVDNVLKGTIPLGARAVVPLPVGADFKIEQVQPNTLAFEAMEHKERQMVALGAKLIEQQKVQRTATEAGLEETSETSILASITNNVSAGFKFALECCSIFAGSTTVTEDANNETIVFELNTEFSLATASPDEIRSTIDAWQKEAITFEEMRAKLRRVGMATVDDNKAAQDIHKAAQQDLEFKKDTQDLLGNPIGTE